MTIRDGFVIQYLRALTGIFKGATNVGTTEIAGIKYIVVDALGLMRACPNRVYSTQPGSTERTVSCDMVLRTTVEYGMMAMQEMPDILGCIYCIDVGKFQTTAKAVEHAKRYANKTQFEFPEGTNPFHDDMRLTSKELEAVFNTRRARKLFLEYLATWFRRSFSVSNELWATRKSSLTTFVVLDMSEERELFVNVLDTQRACQLPNIVMTHDSGNSLGEADVKMFWWQQYFQAHNDESLRGGTLVCSGDFDELLIGMLNFRRRYDPVTKTLKGQRVVIRRSIGGVEYIDVDELCLSLIENRLWQGGDIAEIACPCPLETMVLLCSLVGNDYICSFPGVMFKTIMPAFLKYIRKIGPIVTVEVSEKYTAKAHAASKLSGDPIPVFEYSINAGAFRALIMYCYIVCKPQVAFFEDDILADISLLWTTVMDRYPKTKVGQHSIPATKGDIDSNAARFAWLLAYFGNSYVPGHRLRDPFTRSAKGKSVYGFDILNPTEKPLAGNVARAAEVMQTTKFSCE